MGIYTDSRTYTKLLKLTFSQMVTSEMAFVIWIDLQYLVDSLVPALLALHERGSSKIHFRMCQDVTQRDRACSIKHKHALLLDLILT